MLFSTKAEYGVRFMVELGRRAGADSPEGGRPVALGAVAETEILPLSYLEHLVARLRDAGLVESVRGARGGYRLGKPADEITMLDIVRSLEGPITPMECFEPDGDGRILCSHDPDAHSACATKLLWTRVQGGVIRALESTTLAELAEFAGGHADASRAPAPASA